jgi:hypothetical protein
MAHTSSTYIVGGSLTDLNILSVVDTQETANMTMYFMKKIDVTTYLQGGFSSGINVSLSIR